MSTSSLSLLPPPPGKKSRSSSRSRVSSKLPTYADAQQYAIGEYLLDRTDIEEVLYRMTSAEADFREVFAQEVAFQLDERHAKLSGDDVRTYCVTQMCAYNTQFLTQLTNVLIDLPRPGPGHTRPLRASARANFRMTARKVDITETLIEMNGIRTFELIRIPDAEHEPGTNPWRISGYFVVESHPVRVREDTTLNYPTSTPGKPRLF